MKQVHKRRSLPSSVRVRVPVRVPVRARPLQPGKQASLLEWKEPLAACVGAAGQGQAAAVLAPEKTLD